MDNRINDMATPGCSHWASLPVVKARPAWLLLQALSGVRNTDQNIQRQPSQPAMTLRDPNPFRSESLYQYCRRGLAKEGGRIEKLRLAVPRNADESGKVYASRLVLLSGDIGIISALTGLSTEHILSLRREALANNEGRVEMLRRAYPRLVRENSSGYVRRLAMLSDDITAISMVSGRSLRSVAELRRLVETVKDDRMENLRQAYPRREYESDSEYARRLLAVSKDLKSITLISGAALGTVYRFRSTVIAEQEGRAASLRNTFPKLGHETAYDYVRRLIPLSEDLEAISAVSGMSLGHIRVLKREAPENM